MTYSLQSHEAAVVRFPAPNLTPRDRDDADVLDAIDQAHDATREARDNFACNIEGASDATNEPPLIMAIKQVTAEIAELEEARRRLIAFGRHGVSGKAYAYVSLGAAAGRSDVWAKDVSNDPDAKAAALAAQAELRTAGTQPSPGNHGAVAHSVLDSLLDGLAPAQRGDHFADNAAKLRRILDQFDLSASARHDLITEMRAKYAPTEESS